MRRAGLWSPWRARKRYGTPRVRGDFSGARGSQAMMQARRPKITLSRVRAAFVLPDGSEITRLDIERGVAHLPGADAVVTSEVARKATQKARNQRKRAAQRYRAHRRRRDAP